MEKLLEIHKNLKLKSMRLGRSGMMGELPEQIMIVKHLKSNDIVLELGGASGKSSCIINYILKNKENHVVIEPNIYTNLKKNRDVNNFKFHIETSIISEIPLYLNGWHTNKVGKGRKINNITYDELIKKYNLKFNVLILDCEGNFPIILRSYPNILDNIRLIQIEHDWNCVPNAEEEYKYFKKIMKEKGFKMTDKIMKGEEIGFDRRKKMMKSAPITWVDGLESDAIFVSVWTK